MPRSIHLLCGAGGDATGLLEAGFDPILGINHWQTAVDTFGLNHPNAAARCADIQNYPMRWLPKALVLWASVICTEVSPAGGKKRPDPAQDALFEEEELWRELPPEAFEMTRVTAWCVLRAAEAKRFPCVVVENVVEFITDWLLFPEWIRAMKKLGYRVQIVSVSSAHIGSETNPYAPQWRDRVYLVFTLTEIRRPDLAPRPLAYCFECGRDVKARQSWRDPRVKVGKYQQQYDYRCPNSRCRHALVEPYVRPASDVIMWDDIGQRIGDRARPLVPNTMRRIAAGLAKFPHQPSVVTLTHGKDGTDRAFAPHTRPLPTRTAKLGEALLVPVGGSWNDTASPVGEPMRTRYYPGERSPRHGGPVHRGVPQQLRRRADRRPAEHHRHGSSPRPGRARRRCPHPGTQHVGDPVPQGSAEDRGRAPAHAVDPRLCGRRAQRALDRGLLLPHVAAP
ncbi:DNA cytosine methyltransferase [Streptomyces griseoloalbus]|uniref:DNA cytosine methyltransferase n=1 Tax=Streptomyces griseoloalbus TaxID=67303 RepID=UPI0033B25B64